MRFFFPFNRHKLCIKRFSNMRYKFLILNNGVSKSPILKLFIEIEKWVSKKYSKSLKMGGRKKYDEY